MVQTRLTSGNGYNTWSIRGPAIRVLLGSSGK